MGVIEYQADPKAGLEPLRPLLAALGEVRTLPRQTSTRLYLDTFDWRLHAAGMLLYQEREAGSDWLILRSSKLPQRPLRQRGTLCGRFADGLPGGSIRSRVAPRAQMRALLPIVRLRLRRAPVELRDPEGKILLRVYASEGRVLRAAGVRAGELPARVQIEPMAGYEASAERLAEQIERQLGLEPCTEELDALAMARAERTPGDYGPKRPPELAPELRADQAARAILLRLLDTLEQNEAGLRADLDSEFLHDFRVAVRRTRSILGQLKGVFPRTAIERFQAGFAWLGAVTGPTRDLDVYLLGIPGYRDALAPHLRADLEPLREFLVRHQRTEHRRLVRSLDSRRYGRLRADWRAFLGSAPPARTRLAHATRPVKALADRRIWKLYKRALREGGAIGPGTGAAALHELRKTCKKLRYLLEAFRGLYPAGAMRACIKTLKEFQECLGTFQDLEVQQAKLLGFGEQMTGEGRAPPATLLAMGALIDDLHQRQGAVRAEFAARFERFARPTNHRQYKALFKPRPPTRTTS